MSTPIDDTTTTLTIREQHFVEHYLRDGNATQAAIRAGYSPKHAPRIGSELTKRPAIRACIETGRKNAALRAQLSADRVLLEAARVGLSDIRELFDERDQIKPISEWSDDIAAAVSSIKVVPEYTTDEDGRRVLAGYRREVKFWDKGAGLDKLMRYLGLYDADNRQRGLAAPLSTLPRPVLELMEQRLRDLAALAPADEAPALPDAQEYAATQKMAEMNHAATHHSHNSENVK